MGFPKNLTDSYAFFARRMKGEMALPPLRTFKEMAEEFGLNWLQLRGSMLNSKHNPPKAKLVHRCADAKNSYYDPAEMRAWWKRHNGTSE